MNLERLRDRIISTRPLSVVGFEIGDLSIERIRSWDEWVGPESALSLKIALYQQSLHDAIILVKQEEEWNRALHNVVKLTKGAVPYQQEQDAWYAPNIAVWGAAWTFALEEAYLSCNRSCPRELKAQLYWYERGHWPCSLMSVERMEDIGDYVVF